MNKTKKGLGPASYKKGLGEVKPSFTADRFFIYLIGGAATLAGLYVIYKLLERGISNLDANKQNEQQSLTANKPQESKLANMPRDIVFPIRYEGFNPPYRPEVAQLQNMLVQKGMSLPNYGVDGRFGPETLSAVQNFWGNRLKTSVSKDEFARLMIDIEERKEFAGLGSLGLENPQNKKAVFMLAYPTSLAGCGCGCNSCN